MTRATATTKEDTRGTDLMKKTLLLGAATALSLLTLPAFAQDASAAIPADSVFVFNTLLFLIGGFLVMWMAAGFAMLEAGLVRSKNVSMQCTKNIALFSLAGIMFTLVGYNVLYPGDGNWLYEGWVGNPAPYPIKAYDGEGNLITETAAGYSTGSDFFFQLMFCAATASIVSGTMAERVKLWPFLIFTAALTGLIYPIVASWQWGGGVLSAAGFSDFAGSTLVHSTGGWAALAGAILLGARKGKYRDGQVFPMPGSNMPLATLGTFILWLGWFGFNGGSQLALGSIADADAVSQIFANTNIAASGGAIAAMILTQMLYGKVDLTMVLNGALAGLVSITAEPLAPTMIESMLIGGVGGVIVVFAVPLLDKMRIDDVVGAIPVHLLAGIWGTIAVAFNTQTEISEGVSRTVTEQLMVQLYGIGLVGIFAFGASFILFMILKLFIGIRVSEEDEYIGLDAAEIGIEAYPEFGKGSQSL